MDNKLEELYYTLMDTDFEDWYVEKFIPYVGGETKLKKEDIMKDIKNFFEEFLKSN